jgi:hypothetical protein
MLGWLAGWFGLHKIAGSELGWLIGPEGWLIDVFGT